ncbi:hypothetical protein KRX19_05415 [Cardiobacteriaceae bacterium TAE3-ERU3]|nr:hypothetical protein [Cardiobacteriaceae bacterium TAE3-ERU3]
MDHKSINLYRGDDTQIQFVIHGDIVLTGAQLDMHIKANDSDDVIELSTTSGTITIDDATTCTATIAHAVTKDKQWRNGLYDLQMTKDGKITTLVRGSVSLQHDITITE